MSDEELVRRLRNHGYIPLSNGPEWRYMTLPVKWVEEAADAIERLTRERDEARADAEEWRDKYDAEHKEADELSVNLDEARKDWSLQSKISNGYAEALIAAKKERDEARDVLSALALYLSVGSGDEDTTAEQYEQRIRFGIDAIFKPLQSRAEAAEQKVERLREALKAIASHDLGFAEDKNAARAALTETEKGDE